MHEFNGEEGGEIEKADRQRDHEEFCAMVRNLD